MPSKGVIMEIRDGSKILIIDDINNNKGIYLPSNREYIRKKTSIIYDKAYYLKQDDSFHIINELIGTYLSMLLDLDAVSNKIGLYGDTLYVISELFYKERFEYYYPFESSLNVSHQEFRAKRRELLENSGDSLSIFDNNMLVKILKLISIDLKMGQTDRSGTNITLEYCGLKLNFAPFYDYGSSYKFAEFYTQYKNSYIVLKKDRNSLKEFIKKYPMFMEYLSSIRNIKMSDIIENIEDINGIKLSDEEISYYKEKDKIYSKTFINL